MIIVMMISFYIFGRNVSQFSPGAHAGSFMIVIFF